MNVGDKNTELYIVLDIRTNLLRVVIDMGAGTVRLDPPESCWGAPSLACRLNRGWCG